MTPADHYDEADRLLKRGVEAVQRLQGIAQEREANQDQWGRYTESMDELGKKVMGIWAQAQVHATLATTPRENL